MSWEPALAREPRMNANEHELILKDEVYAIVGAAMEVSNELGAGACKGTANEHK